MIVQPFRSNRPDADVYHTNTMCPEGKAIERSERRKGEGGLPECEVCHSQARVRLAFSGGEETLRHDIRVLAEAEVLAGFGYFIWRPGSEEIFYSEGAYEIHGLTPVGTMLPVATMAGAVHPDDLPSVTDGFTAVAGGGGVYDARHRVVWPDGTVRWVRAKARLIDKTVGNPEYILGTIVDITDEIGP